MDDKWIWIYFGIINLISAGTFIVDKKRAQKIKSIKICNENYC